MTLDDFDLVDGPLIKLLSEPRVGEVRRLLPPGRGELDQRDGAHDQERPERERAERPGPAEFARRGDAVGHQVRLATYGRCRKFSAWSSPYPTRNTRGAANPTNAGSSSRCSATCVCNNAHISRLPGPRSRSSATRRLRGFPVSTISSTRRMCLPRSSVSGAYSSRTFPLEIVSAP